MCLKDIFLSFLFSIIAFLIFVYLYGIVYKFKIYCIEKKWKNKRSLIFRFILARFRHIILYIFTSLILAFSVIVNLVSIKPYEIFLIVLTIFITYLFANIRFKPIFENLEKELAIYTNYIFLYRFLVLILGVLWLGTEYYFYTIELKDMDQILNRKIVCNFTDNIVIINETLENILWKTTIYLKEKANFVVKIVYVLFILIKKISFAWGIVLATLGGVFLWKKK